MEHLTYTITRVVREWELWFLFRSDGTQLVRECWPCEFDLTENIEPVVEPVGFMSKAQAERFVTLYKAGVPIGDIDYLLEAPTGVSSLKWAAR